MTKHTEAEAVAILTAMNARLGEEYEIVNRQFEYESDRFNVRAPNGDWVLETDEPTEWDAITTAADLL